MKTVLRSIASIVVSVVLWFIMYMAIVFLFFALVEKQPAIANFAGRFISAMHANEGGFSMLPTVFAAILPTILPTILHRLIMRPTSEKVQNITTIIVIVLLAIEIITIRAFSVPGRLWAIVCVAVCFWTLGRADA